MLTCLTAQPLPQTQEGCKGFTPHCTKPNPGPSHPVFEGQGREAAEEPCP